MIVTADYFVGLLNIEFLVIAKSKRKNQEKEKRQRQSQ
jgi:hypothetical protein